MMKKNKILPGIVLSLLALGVNNQVYAAGVNINSYGETPGGNTSGNVNENDLYVDWKGYNGTGANANKKYQYRYKKSISTSNSVVMNAYNLSGESIIPYSINNVLSPITAGTWIGININETQSASWRVWDFEFQEIRKQYTCNYAGQGTSTGTSSRICNSTQCADYFYDCNSNSQKYNCTRTFKLTTSTKKGIGLCTIKWTYSTGKVEDSFTTSGTYAYYENYKCPAKYNGLNFSSQESKEVLSNVTGDGPLEKKQEAANEAHNAAAKVVGSPIVSVEYITNNNYPSDLSELIYDKTIAKKVGAGDQRSSGGMSGTIWKTYLHAPEKVCMNLKTAEVTYNEKCTPSEEKGIVLIADSETYDKYLKSTVTYWHYFVPLNMKSDTDFPLRLSKNSDRPLNAEECQYIMKNYSDYINYIVPSTSAGTDSYKNDYSKLKENSNDWKKTKYGCYFKTTINFPITQKFYNEEQEGDKLVFKGYSFYYRPIDIKNPFPNEIAADSYWADWNNQKEKTPDLEKSFNNLTYVATNINANSVRAYNSEKGNQYTSWSNMNINGKSKFIESGINGTKIVTRYANTKSFYKLGCGPANKDWEECR